MIQERLGLLLIGASLAVILTVVGLTARYQRDARLADLRNEGVALARLVSKIPYEQFAPGAGSQGPLQIVASRATPGFAYAVIVDARGQVLSEITAPGVIVPASSPPSEPAAWLDERVIPPADAGRSVREFSAPILSHGELAAHLRIGYFEPDYGSAFEQASFLAMLALPIFLLAPLSYLVIRRAVRPLNVVSSRLRELAQDARIQPYQLEATGQLGEFLGWFNRFVDQTEQRFRDLRAQQTGMLASSKVLSYQKARIEAVLEALPDAAVVADASGTVTFANTKFDGLLGLSSDSIQGRKIEEWCTDPQLLRFLVSYHARASRRVRSDSIEFAPKPSGEQRMSLSAHPLPTGSDEGASAGTLFVFRDVTADAIRRRAQGEFVTHVAHELKAPLNAFATYSELLLGKDGESEEFRIEACNVIQDHVERLATLIDTLMGIARIESGNVRLERQRVRLPEFLRDTLESVSVRGKAADLRFHLELPKELCPVYVDKELLRVAISNLLTNAIKYNREQGSVVLGAEESPESVSIRVSDTGIGVSEEERSRIFEKFYRSERSEVRHRPGHGLGLALCKEIVELHGGEVRVESEPGEGSTFWLVLKKTSALVREARTA